LLLDGHLVARQCLVPKVVEGAAQQPQPLGIELVEDFSRATRLTGRELEVLDLLADGKSDDDIAEPLAISVT
jgi:DNA-binding NarL/FixJ family response regulator